MLAIYLVTQTISPVILSVVAVPRSGAAAESKDACNPAPAPARHSLLCTTHAPAVANAGSFRNSRTRPPVILSVVAVPRSGAAAKSKDPCNPATDPVPARHSLLCATHAPAVANAGIFKNSRTRAFTISPPLVIMVSRIISSCKFNCSFPSFTMYVRNVVRLRAYIWLA